MLDSVLFDDIFPIWAEPLVGETVPALDSVGLWGTAGDWRSDSDVEKDEGKEYRYNTSKEAVLDGHLDTFLLLINALVARQLRPGPRLRRFAANLISDGNVLCNYEYCLNPT